MDYSVGEKASFSKTISEADIYNYAGITGDLNPIHINKVAAENSIFEERIAHGLLVAGFISTVIGMYLPGPGSIYLSQNLRFTKPVKIGDTVTATVIVDEILNKEKGLLKLCTIVTNQEGDCVIQGDAVIKI